MSDAAFDVFTEAVTRAFSNPKYIKVYRVMPRQYTSSLTLVQPGATIYLKLEERFEKLMLRKDAFFFMWIASHHVSEKKRYRNDPRYTRYSTRGWELIPSPVLQELVDIELASHVEAHFDGEIEGKQRLAWRRRDARLREFEKTLIDLPKSSPAWDKRIG